MTKNTDAAAGPGVTTKSKRSDTLRSPPDDAASIYQLKVTLRGTDPGIWRRLLVPRQISLRDLHAVLQIAMGWENYHLYKFQVGKRSYAETEPKSWALGAFGSKIENAGRIRLSDVAPNARATFTYLYDMGDSWSHEVKVEKLLAREREVSYPNCLGGERACPPEDCGGIWGYADLLAALEAPDDPELAERLEWAGPFDPGKFDLDAVNALLAEFRSARSNWDAQALTIPATLPPTPRELEGVAGVGATRAAGMVLSGMAPNTKVSRKSTALLDELRSLRRDILQVATARGARSIHIFGSVARGDATPDSDVDFLVELEPGRSLVDLSGLQLDLVELLGRPIHVVQIPSVLPATAAKVAEQIRGEAVPL